jgi:hypothetical protein
MRVLGFLGALAVGLVLWGLTLALSDGVAPLGKTGRNEATVFFMPIIVFALPLATIAFTREYVLSATWILAAAPGLGFLNFAFAVWTMSGEPAARDTALSIPTLLTLVAGWLFFLGLILAATWALRNSAAGDNGERDA